MKNRKKKHAKKHAKKHDMNRKNRLHETRSGDVDRLERVLIIEELEDGSLSGVLEAEPVPFQTRKKALLFNLLLHVAIWAVFLRFVTAHILLRIFILIILTLFTYNRFYWEIIFWLCPGQTREMRWTLSEDALLLDDERIPYKSISKIYLAVSEGVLKRRQPSSYACIIAEDRSVIFFSRRTGTEKEIEESEIDVTGFLFMLGEAKQEHDKNEEEA